jgi:hypothetical protein
MIRKSLIILFAALVIFAGCFIPIPIPEEEKPFDPPAAALTENVWNDDGRFGALDEYQWFKFTASESSHTIHVIFSTGSLDKLSFQLHDSDGKKIGNRVVISKSDYNKYLTYSSFTAGQEYYIKIERGGYNSTDSGTYKIAFSKSETTPVTIKLPSNAIQLTVKTFADGNIPDGVGEQWFKFTTTAAAQYIHVNFGTLTDLDIQLYKVNDSIYVIPLGADTELTYTTKYTSRTLNVNEEYYIKVTPHNSFFHKGTYKIAFSELFISPDFEIKPLTEDTWADGEITKDGEVHWYKFTATAITQYIHASFGTMNDWSGLRIQLYDFDGKTIGSEGKLREDPFNTDKKYADRTLNANQVYFIKVYLYTYLSLDLGTYQIAFNKDTTPPTP